MGQGAGGNPGSRGDGSSSPPRVEWPNPRSYAGGAPAGAPPNMDSRGSNAFDFGENQGIPPGVATPLDLVPFGEQSLTMLEIGQLNLPDFSFLSRPLTQDLDLVSEPELQAMLPIKWDIPFHAPEKPEFTFIDLFQLTAYMYRAIYY